MLEQTSHSKRQSTSCQVPNSKSSSRDEIFISVEGDFCGYDDHYRGGEPLHSRARTRLNIFDKYLGGFSGVGVAFGVRDDDCNCCGCFVGSATVLALVKIPFVRSFSGP